MNPSYCLIKSSDRTTGNSNQFQIDLLVPIQGVKKVSLAQATIPNTIYNIQTNVNDRFNFFRGSRYPYNYHILSEEYSNNSLPDPPTDSHKMSWPPDPSSHQQISLVFSL